MQSIWSKTTDLPEQKQLKGNVQVENVVIGAGMAGVLIAYFLQNRKIRQSRTIISHKIPNLLLRCATGRIL